MVGKLMVDSEESNGPFSFSSSAEERAGEMMRPSNINSPTIHLALNFDFSIDYAIGRNSLDSETGLSMKEQTL